MVLTGARWHKSEVLQFGVRYRTDTPTDTQPLRSEAMPPSALAPEVNLRAQRPWALIDFIAFAA